MLRVVLKLKSLREWGSSHDRPHKEESHRGDRMTAMGWIALYLWVGMFIVVVGWERCDAIMERKREEYEGRGQDTERVKLKSRIIVLFFWPAAILMTLILGKKI